MQPLREQKVRLYRQDLLNLADNLNRLNTMEGFVSGSMDYETGSSVVANFGVEFDEEDGEHYVTFPTLVRVED